MNGLSNNNEDGRCDNCVDLKEKLKETFRLLDLEREKTKELQRELQQLRIKFNFNLLKDQHGLNQNNGHHHHHGNQEGAGEDEINSSEEPLVSLNIKEESLQLHEEVEIPYENEEYSNYLIEDNSTEDHQDHFPPPPPPPPPPTNDINQSMESTLSSSSSSLLSLSSSSSSSSSSSPPSSPKRLKESTITNKRKDLSLMNNTRRIKRTRSSRKREYFGDENDDDNDDSASLSTTPRRRGAVCTTPISRPHACYCKVCGMKFESKAEMVEHEKASGHEFRFACNYCSSMFRQKIQMTRHQEQVHNTGVMFYCKICDRPFKNEFSKNRHEANVDMHKRLFRPIQKCHICGIELARRNKWAMNQHVRKHGLTIHQYLQEINTSDIIDEDHNN